MKFPVVELAEDKFQVSVDINLYAKEVLTAAIYLQVFPPVLYSSTNGC